MHAIECIGLTVAFRRAQAVCGVSLSVSAGEHVALFGGTGAGKSTLLAAIAGLLPAEEGSVRVLGRPPSPGRPDVAFVSASLDTPPNATVASAISRSLSRLRLPRSLRAARIAEALELLGLAGLEDRSVRELSRGGRAATALACAIAPHPAVLLLDNVLADLPPTQADRLFRHLADRRSIDGLALLHASLSSREAERAERVILLDAGRCVADASPAELIARHASDTLTVEAEDPRAVRRTLRGLFDVEIAASEGELRFSARDAASTAAHLFRHPEGGLRAVCVRRGDLWDVLARLREDRPAST